MKNKILHIVQEASYNGATIYAFRLCTKLNEYAQEIVSCFNGNAYNEIKSQTDCEILLGSKEVRYKYLLLKYWRFLKFIRKKNFDIIHYHQGGVGILLLAYLFRKNAVIVHHLHSGNLIGDNTKKNISIIHSTILKYLSNKTFQVAVSEYVFTEYSEKIGFTKKLKLIRNSTPFAFEEKATKRNAIGFIGRFTKEKGFHLLPDIAIMLQKKFQEIKILIMGDEPELSKRYFGEIPVNINLISPELSTEKFYRSIDILLFPSIATEGMPLVVLEAISFDVGVIAYQSPALKEIIGDEYPLFMYSKDDIVKLISSYYEDKIDLTGMSSIHKNVSIKHDEKKMLDEIRKLYGDILAKDYF